MCLVPFLFRPLIMYVHNRFYFDFSATYVGVGMICPYIINISLLIGGILSWGVMWPLIDAKKGDWYSADLKQSSLHGLQGYKVSFLSTFHFFFKLHAYILRFKGYAPSA